MLNGRNLWVCLFMSLFISGLSGATVYYVDGDPNNGNNDANGLTLQTPWLTIQKAATTLTAGDTVYIKAGTYNEQVTIASSGTSSLPIVFEGYKDTPGDNPSFADFQYDDPVDPNLMPLLDGGDRALDQIGILVDRSYPEVCEYITIRNIQITNYNKGFLALGAKNVTLDNIIARDFGDINDPNDYGGIGIRFDTTNNSNNTIKNCIVVNAKGENYTIVGDNNLIDNCQSYCDDNRTGIVSATDYYMVIFGDDNVIKNCYVERVGNLDHMGHGIHFKTNAHEETSEGNIVKDCEARNLGNCFKARHRGAKYNTFENCTAWGPSEDPATVKKIRGFVCVDGASYNTFNNCRAIGTYSGVFFTDGDEDDGPQYAGSNNTFENCLFEDITDAAIDFYHWQYQTDADNNRFKKCVISNCNMLFRGERPNQGNLMSDCAVLNTDYFDQTWDSEPDNFTVYDVNCDFTFTNFSDNGFGDCSTVARFRFDSSSNNTTADSSWKANDGTLTNGVLQSTSGIKGGALEFDGIDDYVDAGSDSSLELDEFTYSAWIKPAAIDREYQCIIGKENQWYKGFYIAYDSLRGFVRHDTVNASMRCNGVITTDWQHVAMTYSNGQIKLYHNGQLLTPFSTSIGSGDLTSTADNSLRISASYNPFIGLIDEVYVYPVALDDDAVFKTYLEQSSLCHFRFDDGIGDSAIDSCSGDYASLNGSPVWYPSEGVDGGALCFDGIDDYVDAGSDSSLELDEFTYSAWIKPDSITAQYQCIIGKNSIWRKGFFVSYNDLRGYVRHDNVGASTLCNDVITADWQHVAMTYSNGEVKLYRNGQLLTPDTATTGSGDLTSTATYSLCVSDSSTPFDGLVDEVKIYTRVLSAEEIYKLANSGVENATQHQWFTSIQDAINDANDFDEIVVYPGTYEEAIDFLGKSITLRSVDPSDWDVVEATVIDGNSLYDHVVTFDDSEDADSVLNGFTITGGDANGGADLDKKGAGIFCYSANSTVSPTIQNCIIENNRAQYGAGIYNYNSAATLDRCIFKGNSTTSSGGAVQNTDSAVEIRNCVFYDNDAKWGGAMHNDTSDTIITNCTFTLNEANYYSGGGQGGAIRNYDYSDPVVTNCIFWNNSAYVSEPEISNSANSSSDMTYSDLAGGYPGTGNINTDPNFVDDYLLSSGSACIDAGDPNGVYTGQTDIEGDDRVIDGDDDEDDRVDMGADEYAD